MRPASTIARVRSEEPAAGVRVSDGVAGRLSRRSADFYLTSMVPVRWARVGRGSGGSRHPVAIGFAGAGGRRITGCCDADHDLGASFQEHRSRWHVVAGLVTAVLATALFLGAGGFILFGAAVVAALGLGRWMSGLLGGMTGDAYGAVNELCEVVVLILGVALVPLTPDVFQAPLW